MINSKTESRWLWSAFVDRVHIPEAFTEVRVLFSFDWTERDHMPTSRYSWRWAKSHPNLVDWEVEKELFPEIKWVLLIEKEELNGC